jgi:polar amino acid transport system substrate-binding protein
MATVFQIGAAVLSIVSSQLAAAACPVVTRVGISDRGYASFRSANSYAGIGVDIFLELSRRTGCKIEFIWLPSARIITDMKARQIDASPTLLRNSERDYIATYLPYGYTKFYLVVAKRIGPPHLSWQEFLINSHARVNMVRGLSLGPKIDQDLALLARAGRLELVNNFDTVFKKMAVRRADAVLGSVEVLQRGINLAALQDAVTLVPLTNQLPIGMYLSTLTLPAETINCYATALRAIVEDGTVRAIYRRYLPPSQVQQLFVSSTGKIAITVNPC